MAFFGVFDETIDLRFIRRFAWPERLFEARGFCALRDGKIFFHQMFEISLRRHSQSLGALQHRGNFLLAKTLYGNSSVRCGHAGSFPCQHLSLSIWCRRRWRTRITTTRAIESRAGGCRFATRLGIVQFASPRLLRILSSSQCPNSPFKRRLIRLCSTIGLAACRRQRISIGKYWN